MAAPNATFPSGTPIAAPSYLVDVNGNPISSQSVSATQSGIWTMQPGNTQNSTSWKMIEDNSAAILAELNTLAAQQAGPYNVTFATPQQVQGGTNAQTGLSAGALNADLFPSTDVSNYKSAVLGLSGTWSGTLTIQGSNDNFVTQTFALAATRLDGIGAASSTATTNLGLYIPLGYQYLRIRMTSYASGTANGVLLLNTSVLPIAPQVVSAAQSSTWTVQPGNTPNTTPWLITQANNNASVPTGAANTVVKNAAGQLASLVVTTAGTGAGNVQIFDNATTNSGTVLFAFPATVSVAQRYPIYGWAKAGMTAQNVANGPVFTVFYS